MCNISRTYHKSANEEVQYERGTSRLERWNYSKIIFNESYCYSCISLQHLVTYGRLQKGHVKITFLPVITILFPPFCAKLEQTLQKHQKQHSWHANNNFFFKKKGASKYLKRPHYEQEWLQMNHET